MKNIFLALLSVLFFAGSLRAETLQFAGVLGNSGEQGAALVRFGGDASAGSFNSKGASGIGVACDRFGTLWDRAGAGVLNRYAVDGRLLASYKLPGNSAAGDSIVALGDTIILRLGNELYSLAIDAPSGSDLKKLKISANLISLTAHDGWIAAARGHEIFLVNAAGESRPVGALDIGKAPDGSIGFEADGKVLISYRGTMYRVDGAANGPTLVGPTPGERAQFINGYWYGHGHHSTIRRFDAELKAAPGVIMGGNSGSFIGHVDEQAEVVNGRGLARISPTLFALSGAGGIVHLLEWNQKDVRFEPIRRIGAVNACNALGLDREGRVWFKSGVWNWSDGPATPLRWGIPEPEKMFGISMLDSDIAVGYGSMWTRPTVMFGKFDKEVKLARIESQPDLPKEAQAVTVTEYQKKRLLLVLEKDGKVSALAIGDDGKFLSDAGAVELKTAAPLKNWTSLQAVGDKLLAAADGHVIELARDGAAWKETKRWNSWGGSAQEKFGDKIHLAADAGRLWVTDSARHRVVCMSLDGNKLIGEFGGSDKKGDDLAHLSAPTVVSARGSRAVIFDSGNQRIVKLQVVK